MDQKKLINTTETDASELVFKSTINKIISENSVRNNLTISNSTKANICKTCGTRFAHDKFKSDQCPVCLDDRQYIKEYGQEWLSYNELSEKHTVKINSLNTNIHDLSLQPSFAIGQKAHFITTPSGNFLWDCIPLIDENSASFISEKGGLKAIAISHPHYYSLMAEWASHFNCPIYLHSDDREWVMDTTSNIIFWEGDYLSLSEDVTIIRTGGHFPGSTILHYEDNAKGTVFCGDTIYLSRDRRHISAMYSYPNVIPLNPEKLFNIFNTIAELRFDSLYGAFEWQNIHKGAKTILSNSLNRYRQIYNWRG